MNLVTLKVRYVRLLHRVSSERNVSRNNAKIFGRSKLFRENKLSENKAKFYEIFFRENAKYENVVSYTTFHFSQTLPLLFILFSESQTLPLILGKLVIWKQKKMVRKL